MARRIASQATVVDLFVHSYRISGHVSTRTHSIADMLNDTMRSYMHLYDVYLSRINRPADIVARYPYAELRKDNLLFAIVPARESLSKITRAVSYFGKERYAAWLGLPMFEIEGALQAPGMPFDLEAYLTEKPGQYLAIEDATARPTTWPDIEFSGEAMLVNQRCIDLFCLGQGAD